MQIKKCNYEKYEEQPGKERKLTAKGYCYYLFWSRWSPRGIRIPWTLRITDYYA